MNLQLNLVRYQSLLGEIERGLSAPQLSPKYVDTWIHECETLKEIFTNLSDDQRKQPVIAKELKTIQIKSQNTQKVLKEQSVALKTLAQLPSLTNEVDTIQKTLEKTFSPPAPPPEPLEKKPQAAETPPKISPPALSSEFQPTEVKSCPTTRLIALRDLVIGVPVDRFKGLITNTLSGMALLVKRVYDVHRDKNAYQAGVNSLKIFLLFSKFWTLGTLKIILWTPYLLAKALVGVFSPKAWVTIHPNEKRPPSSKNILRMLFGFLSPQDGRIRTTQDGAPVEYTTRLEQEVDERVDRWIQFDDTIDKILS